MTNVRTTVELITPDKAERYLSHNDSNRNVKEDHVNFLASEMKLGKWKFTAEPIKIGEDGRLLDGQHRLLAIVKSNKSFEFLVVKNLDNEIFDVLDTGFNRSAADVVGIAGFGNPNQKSATAKFIISFEKGLFENAAESKSKKKARISNADIVNFVDKHHDRLVDSLKYGYNKFNKLMPPAQLAGMHFILKKIDEKNANEFCESVADGANLPKTSPIYLFRERLIIGDRNKLRINGKEKLALFIKAWNIFRSKKSKIRLLYAPAKEGFPKPI